MSDQYELPRDSQQNGTEQNGFADKMALVRKLQDAQRVAYERKKLSMLGGSATKPMNTSILQRNGQLTLD